MTDSPCQTSANGINVRIKNIGKIAFSKIAINYKNKDLVFAGLNPGDSTCYKNTPSIRTNFNVVVYFSKQSGYYMKLITVGVDFLGERQITQGYATIEVEVTKDNGQLSSGEHVTIDSK